MPEQRRDDEDRAAVDPQLLAALTTEHFTLQGARAATISESASRSTIFIGAVSSALVALGFVAQLSDAGSVFRVFAFTALPALLILRLFTWVSEGAREGPRGQRGGRREPLGDVLRLPGGWRDPGDGGGGAAPRRAGASASIRRIEAEAAVVWR